MVREHVQTTPSGEMTPLRAASWTAMLGVLAAPIFLLLPEIDLLVSDWWYREGSGFLLQNVEAFAGFSPLVRRTGALIAILLLALIGWRSLPMAPSWLPRRRTLVYLFAVLALGPGLLVNAVFKEHWDRPRPRDVVQFGGTEQFSPALVVGEGCESNCSFVSGDASLGFALAALGFAFARWRRRLLALGIVAGASLGLVRIGLGAHFLSDIYYAGIFVLLVAALLHRVMFPEEAGG